MSEANYITAAKKQAYNFGFNYGYADSDYWLHEMKSIVKALTMLELMSEYDACELVETSFWQAYADATKPL
jgi:hypothetical protein